LPAALVRWPVLMVSGVPAVVGVMPGRPVMALPGLMARRVRCYRAMVVSVVLVGPAVMVPRGVPRVWPVRVAVRRQSGFRAAVVMGLRVVQGVPGVPVVRVLMPRG